MFISEIEFKNYRNLEHRKIKLNNGLNILLGPNGSGKTNFLELFYIMSKGNIFRQGNLKDTIKEGKSYFYVNANLIKNEMHNKIQIGINLENQKILINGKKQSKNKTKIFFPTVLFSPESLSVIKNSDMERRDLIDDLVLFCFSDKIDTFVDYQRIYQQKKKFLAVNHKKLNMDKESQVVLHSLNKKFLPLAAEITLLRIKAIEKIKFFWQKCLEEFFSLSKNVEISVEYLISKQVANEWNYEKIFNAMYNRMSELENFELTSGKVLVGPNKHDLNFYINGKNARYFGSQGQQRSLIIAFKMAQVKLHYQTHGYHPILLLDDVLSELDEFKREALLSYFKTIKSQVILTTTEIEESFIKKLGISSYMKIDRGFFLNNLDQKIGDVCV